MQILQTIISYLAIAGAFLSSLFSWGEPALIPYSNEYTIPESIPEYNVISTGEKTDWKAKWKFASGINKLWNKTNLCLNPSSEISS